MRVIEKIKGFSFILPIAYFIVGIVMIIFPKVICDIVNYFVGGLLILYGIDYIIKYLQVNKITTFSKYSLTIGIIPIICGMFLICNPTVLLSIIPFIAGMIILMDSFEKLKHALDLKALGYEEWWVNLVIAILFILFGLLIIINPFEVTETLVRIIGIFFLVDCLADFWTYFSYDKIRLQNSLSKKNVVIDEKSNN